MESESIQMRRLMLLTFLPNFLADSTLIPSSRKLQEPMKIHSWDAGVILLQLQIAVDRYKTRFASFSQVFLSIDSSYTDSLINAMRYSISNKNNKVIKEGLADVEMLSQNSMMSPLYTSDDVINTPSLITLTSLLYIEEEGFYAFRIRSNNPDPSVCITSFLQLTPIHYHINSISLLTARLTISSSPSTTLLSTIAGSF